MERFALVMTSLSALLSLPSKFAVMGPVVLRAGLGAVFLAHAYAKVFVFTLPGTAHFFEANGFPGVLAYPVFAAELIGGVALIAGFRTRAVSAVLFAIMLGALRPHLANGWMFTNAGGGWEYVAFLLAALAAQIFLGPGAAPARYSKANRG